MLRSDWSRIAGRSASIAVLACAVLPAGEALAQMEGSVPVERVLRFPSGMTDERYAFHRIEDVSVTGDGRILVLDQARLGVRVFGTDGSYLGAFGREGDGPGEFRYPGGVGVLGDTAYVVGQHGRLAAFLLDGTLLWDARLAFGVGDPIPLGGGELILTHGSLQRASDRPREASPEPRQVSFYRVADEGAGVEVAFTGFRGTIWWSPGPGESRWQPAAAYGGPEWVAGGDRGVAFLVDGYRGTIRRLTLTRDDPRDAPVVGELDVDTRAFDREALLDSLVEWENAPRYRGVMGDEMRRVEPEPIDGGRIVLPPADGWVRRVIPLDPRRFLVEVKLGGFKILDWRTEWRLVTVEGRDVTVRTVAVPDGFVPHAGKDDLLVGVATDELEVETIEVFRLGG